MQRGCVGGVRLLQDASVAEVNLAERQRTAPVALSNARLLDELLQVTLPQLLLQLLHQLQSVLEDTAADQASPEAVVSCLLSLLAQNLIFLK